MFGVSGRRVRAFKPVVLSTVTAMVVSLGVFLAPEAQAADPGVAETKATLQQVADWSKGLGGVGKLGQAMPLLSTSPGAPLGLDDALQKAVVDQLPASPSVWNDLNHDADFSIAGSRHGHLTTAVSDVTGGGKQVTVDLSLTGTASSEPLSFADGSGAVKFAASGGVKVDSTLTLHLAVVWAGVGDVYLVKDANGPSITVAATASLPSPTTVSASIGILGVTLGAGSSLTVDAHLKASVSDPNSDGRLYFDAPGGGAADGELAAANSLTGLVTMDLDNPAGSATGHFVVNAAATGGGGPNLPAVSATIDVAWPNIAAGSPSITSSGLSSVADFLTMSPLDLAQGLAQVTTGLDSLERRKLPSGGNVDLPFMKGTVADAVKLNETLKTFLTKWVYPNPNPSDPAKAGQPKFQSLQELVQHLGEPLGVTGLSITVPNLDYDPTKHKVALELALTHTAPASPQPLDAAGALASGGSGTTYTDTKLFDPSQSWTSDQWKGRRVIAGNVGGTVASNDATSITLDKPWTGPTPLANSPYSINDSAAQVGSVSFADLLTNGTKQGVHDANAATAVATVTPSYLAHLTLVLDLQPAKTGNDCSPNPCPYTVDNGDGSKTIINQQPLGVDRVLIRTKGVADLFTASIPIHTAVDLFANAGFFEVRLQGTLDVCAATDGPGCTGTATGDPMVSIKWKSGLGDADGDLSMADLFSKLVSDPGSLVTYATHIDAGADVTASIPDAAAFLPPGSGGITATWDDVGGGTSPVVDTSHITELFKLDFSPDDPHAYFTVVLKTLQTLADQIDKANPGGAFDTKIPVLGQSFRDLLRSSDSGGGKDVTYTANTLKDPTHTFDAAKVVGRTVVAGTELNVVKAVLGDGSLQFTDSWKTVPAAGSPYVFRTELDDAISLLQAFPPDSMQRLVSMLKARLGNNSLVKLDYQVDGTTPSVVVGLDWKRGYSVTSPVRFDFNTSATGDRSIVGTQANGSVSLDVTGDLALNVVVPLTPPTTGPLPDIRILDSSHISLGVTGGFSGTVQGNIGPLSVSLGDPSSSNKAVAQGSYKLSLKDSAADPQHPQPADFSTFASGLDFGLDNTATPAVCNGVDSNGADLSLCAKMPLYVSADGTNWTTATASGSNAFVVRMPRTSSLTDAFDFGGADVGSPGLPRLETPDPNALLDALQAAILDFSKLGDGFDGYLALLQQGLQTASAGGKLPLVGEDLQEGADFIGKLRKTLDDQIWSQLPNHGRIPDASGIQTWLNDKLKTALTDAGLNPASFQFEFTCTTKLAPVTPAPTLTPDPTGGGTTWEYAVAAVTTNSAGTSSKDSTLSPVATTTDGPADFDGSHKVSLTWTKSDFADGYRVVRRANTGDPWKEVSDKDHPVTGTTFDDVTPIASATDYTPAGSDPVLENCDHTGVSLQDISGVQIRVNLGQGTVSPADGCTGADCLSKTLPLDIGIPGLALKADQTAAPGNGVKVQLGWQLHLVFGLDREHGFFVKTKDDPNPELGVGIAVRMPTPGVGGTQLKAQLAILNIAIKNAQNPDDALFAGEFGVDIRADASNTGEFLTLASIQDASSITDIIHPVLTAKVNIDWTIDADVDQALPGVHVQDFVITWSWSNDAPGSNASNLHIAFNDVEINAGSFFSNLFGPVLKQLKTVTGPLQPVIDTLYAPIPVLSDLSHLAGGDDVTLITLAKTFSTLVGGPKLDFVDRVAAIITLINKLPTAGNVMIPVGSFEVVGSDALDTPNTPDSGGNLIDQANTHANTNVTQKLNQANNNTGQSNVLSTSSNTDQPDPSSLSGKAGFSFPIVQKPTTVFKLLMGQDIDLVTFDSGPLTLGFDWRQSFGPIYAPPPVMLTLSGGAQVTAHIVAGFDTYGIRQLVQQIQDGTATPAQGVADILSGLYFRTTDDNGKPLPVVTFYGEIAAGAAVSAVIIEVGIEGGLSLTINFNWRDPNNDGKFRITEFLATALSNPLCLFTVDGKISLFIRVYITIGFSPFSVTFSFTLANITLLDFSVQADCTPPPPTLGGVSDDGTLYLFAGSLGGPTYRGSPWDNPDGDQFKVTELHDFPDSGGATYKGVAVDALGEHWEFLNATLGITIKRVVVDAHSYGKDMKVTFTGDGDKSKTDPAPDSPRPKTTPFDLPVYYAGGTGVDTVLSGQGSSFVDGNGGDDVITTADDPSRVTGAHAVVAGGQGGDNVTVGGGDDTVAGDSALAYSTTTVTVHRPNTKGAYTDGYPGGNNLSITALDWSAFGSALPSSASTGSDGNDHLSAGLGKNKVYGNGGDDSIGIAADSPQAALHPADPSLVSQGDTIVGGDGTDQIAAGSGDDTIYTADEAATTEDGAGSDDAGTNVSNTVDTGTGSDTVYGGNAPDFVTGHSKATQQDKIYGGAGEDVLAGGFGSDEIFGGPGDDWVVAEPSTISGVTGGDPFAGAFGPFRTVTHLPLPDGTAPSHKLLVGGDDNDHVVGGDGGADIFGDRHRDACVLGSDPESTPPAETPDGAGEHAGRDLVLGGEGVDIVAAGGADDRVESFGAADRDCGQAGDDVILAGTGDDVAYGGTGNDVEQGDSGADRVYGNDGADTLYGNQGTDVLEGNDGSDTEFGGTENDLVVGGTRKAGATDTGGDTLYGDDGNDTLIGDNGTGGTTGDPNDRPRPFDLSGSPATAGAADTIYGGNGDDLGFGGLGDDTMSAGPDQDHFEGNNGSDTVNGDQGEDEVVGGSFEVSGPNGSWPAGRPDSGDVLNGGAGPDVVVGDNADVQRVASGGSPLLAGRGFTYLHSITLLDLGFTPVGGTSGDDQVSGDAGNDVLFGQGGQDRIKGGTQDDYAEGGQGADWVEGNAGDDDLVGGSSTTFQGTGLGTSGQADTADALWGGGGDDVALGDNGVVLRSGPFTKATDRLGTTSAGDRMARRQVVMYDLQNGGSLLSEPTADRFGGDQISGGQGVDVLYGQDGADAISGGGDGDYLEGNGGTDLLRGDVPLDATGDSPPVAPLAVSWPGSASAAGDLNGPSSVDGQDDELGGSSMQGFRDAGDLIEGGGAADVQLGDNGSLVRTVNGTTPGALTEAVYTARYPSNAVPADATRSRTHDPALPGPSTRFCSQPAASATCEAAGAFGADTMYGDGGDDAMWGQDGNDVMRGGEGRDDMYGELGDDQMWGEAGDDAMIGDRGGIADYAIDGAADDPGSPFTVTNGGVPKETYSGLQTGSYARQFDLLHDVDGNAFVGTSSSAAMAHPGLNQGGNDRMRGGSGADNVHGAFGDDLANGDSGGDQVFGDDGADVLWGGKGCDPVLDAAAPDCKTGGVFDPTARGTNDRMVDHVFGGAGATSGPSIAGALGSDLLDFNPRGDYTSCTSNPWPTTAGSGTTVDPCAWFVMTDKDDADVTNNQHHQGTDWLYGGWDRDVLQGDVAQNGPNPGDRLLDWNGAYNLYTHCNSAYGGYNDVRQHSPSMQDFLQKLVWGSGAGQSVSDATTSGTSAFRELALVNPGSDNAHGSGSAYPSTPGHFDDPASCSD